MVIWRVLFTPLTVTVLLEVMEATLLVPGFWKAMTALPPRVMGPELRVRPLALVLVKTGVPALAPLVAPVSLRAPVPRLLAAMPPAEILMVPR